MTMLQALVDGLNHAEYDLVGYEPTYTDQWITSLTFYHNLAFIQKGENVEPSHMLPPHPRERRRFAKPPKAKAKRSRLRRPPPADVRRGGSSARSSRGRCDGPGRSRRVGPSSDRLAPTASRPSGQVASMSSPRIGSRSTTVT